jgi:hypothetical protein
MKLPLLLVAILSWAAAHATAATVLLSNGTNGPAIQVLGDKDDEWRFQSSENLLTWTDAAGLGVVFSDAAPKGLGSDLLASPARFLRATKTAGLYDDMLVRTFHITFPGSAWATQLANSRTAGTNTFGSLVLENGASATNVGFRYKGNTSYQMGGTKKSINIEIDATNSLQELMGHETVNINNAAGDSTILRETLYFNVMREYVACPEASFARVNINGAYWGLYSLVEQENNDLIRKYFPSDSGDRWRTPNAPAGNGGGPGGGPGGGGGGGFSGAGSALTYLGNTNLATYQSNYELKSNGTSNAWANLIHAITVLGTTPTTELRDKVEDVLAVDPWLWYLGLEIVFADDDSYWNKGADYGFYFEAESGRIHPVQHDGNEAFITADVSLSPVIGSTGTNRPVISKLLAVPELRQRYLAHFRTILEERFNPAYMTALVDRYHALTAQAVAEDTKKSFTMAAYTNALTALKGFVTNRYNYLTTHAELTPRQPSISAVSTPTPAPTPTEVPFITATVAAAAAGEGIDSVWLYWREHKYGRFSRRQMFDDGANGDGAAGDGTYGATTTNYVAGNRIWYYVEARSSNTAKAARFFPARAELEPLSYRVRTSTVSDSPVVISEVMASNSRTIADPQGEYDDWIELHNVSDAAVDLAGRYLSDDADSPRKWTFPAGTVIPAGGYLVVWADEDGTATPGLHASFKLSASGEQVLLVDSDANGNGLMDSVMFPTLADGESWGRPSANPTVLVRLTPTPGSANP